MSDNNQTTYSDDQDTGYFDSARDDRGTGDRRAPAGGSSAAERLGGPSGSDAATEENAGGADARTESGEAESRRDGAGSRNGATAAEDTPERLIDRGRAEEYQARWKDIKGDFVDEPRRAVRGANELVGEVLDQLEELFRNQRTDIEKGLDSNDTTTEDLRLALGKYRSFFERLLSI